jgi:fucose permease
MHAGFLLAGLATMLLGPILPLLSHNWHLADSQAGLLLLAQFTGATLGGATVSQRLPQAFLLGLLSGCCGFLAFALAPSLVPACLALLLAGFGVGRIIASLNIIAGARYTHQRGSALSRLNISFSLGCLLSPLLAAQLAPRFKLPDLIASLAALFAVVALILSFELRKTSLKTIETEATTTPILTPIFLFFAAILFLYGGLETCLSGWLTTYALRYGSGSLVLSQYTMVLLLCGLTAGRALAAWLLLRTREATLLRIALALTIACAAALATATNAAVIAALAVLLGISLAPIFPASFALYMANKPSARQAGLVLAASGLGAAAIPWLMGVVSTHAGSLKLALTLPVFAALTLLLMSGRAASTQQQIKN